MVRCKGHLEGTGCTRASKYTTAMNWKLWQLCYGCARKLHPEAYEDQPNHGVGDNKLNVKVYSDLITMPMPVPVIMQT